MFPKPFARSACVSTCRETRPLSVPRSYLRNAPTYPPSACLLALLALCIIERFTEVCKLRTGYRPRRAEPPLFPGERNKFCCGQFPPAKYAFRYPRIVRKLQVGRLISESLINCCLLCVETLSLRQSVRSLNFYYSILFIRLSFSEVKLL